jgi:hypothetical protein
LLCHDDGGIGPSTDELWYTGSVPEETNVERLTLVSELDWMYFEPPVFLQPGETFWTEAHTLYIRSVDGDVRQVRARPSRPDDRR